MEVSSGWLDAAEREERGFLAGEELAMPLPVLSSSSDDEHGLFARHPPPSSQKTLPAPSEEYTRQLLYGASAHSHASRGLKGMSFFQQLRREDEGEGIIPPSHRLSRLHASELSIQRFEELQAAPLVIEGMGSAEGWPIARSCADEASFLSAMGDSLQLPITELLPTHGMGKPQKLRLRLREYRAYAEENEVDFPYYPWERDFDRERAHLLREFWPPEAFSLARDLYGVSDAMRRIFPFSCHRFLICGGERTGAVAHQDPKCSAAWNTCLFGMKRWVFLPPSVTAEQMRQLAYDDDVPPAASMGANNLSNADSEDYRQTPPGYWWLDSFPRLRASGLPMLEVLQRPGDTIYIPPRWWHAVINLPDAPTEVLTLCVTQNLLTERMLLELVGWSDFRAHVSASTALEFLHELRCHRPEVVAKVVSSCSPEERQEIEEDERIRLVGEDKETHVEGANGEVEMLARDGSAAFKEEVRRRASESKHARTLAIPAHPADMTGALRCCAADMSLTQFRQRCVRERRPALLSGFLNVHPSSTACPPPGTLAWLRLLRDDPALCGKHVPVLQQLPLHDSAASQQASKLMLLGELASEIMEGRGEGLYMYDVSVPKQLPALLPHLRLPRHVSHDYLKRTMRLHTYSNSWPTVFLGARGTRSTLHVDLWQGHFWMVCLHGSKRWTIFHPDDTHLLYPSWDHGGLHPKFPSLLVLRTNPEAYPLFAKARCEELVIEAGELLFVPGGTPHAVENVSDCLAIAGNFVDDSNLDAALRDMRVLGLVNESVSAAADALDEMEFDPLVGMIDELLPEEELTVHAMPEENCV